MGKDWLLPQVAANSHAVMGMNRCSYYYIFLFIWLILGGGFGTLSFCFGNFLYARITLLT